MPAHTHIIHIHINKITVIYSQEAEMLLAGGDCSDVVQVLYCGYYLLLASRGIEIFYRRCRLVPSLIKKNRLQQVMVGSLVDAIFQK